MPEVVLFAPESYNTATKEVKEAVVNGCGTSGWKGRLVPDTIYGLCITPSCNIHDWMYTCGSTLSDKDEADRVLLNNLLRQIDSDTNFFRRLGLIKDLMKTRAREYYEAVHFFGGPAFWANKNNSSNLMTIPKQ